MRNKSCGNGSKNCVAFRNAMRNGIAIGNPRSKSAGAVPQFTTALSSVVADRKGTKVRANIGDFDRSTTRVLELSRYPSNVPVASKAAPSGIKTLTRPSESDVTVWLAPPLTVYTIVTPGRTELSAPFRVINLKLESSLGVVVVVPGK